MARKNFNKVDEMEVFELSLILELGRGFFRDPVPLEEKRYLWKKYGAEYMALWLKFEEFHYFNEVVGSYFCKPFTRPVMFYQMEIDPGLYVDCYSQIGMTQPDGTILKIGMQKDYLIEHDLLTDVEKKLLNETN